MPVAELPDMQQHSGHAFILGSGIAGLSLAEILSRNGWRITLLDSAHDLGGDASRSTQNWLHTGWLYAGLPYASAMRDCAKALRLFQTTYASVLPSEILNIQAGDQGVAYPVSSSGWFSPERVHYAFAVATRDLSALQKATWSRYLDCVPLRRLRGLGYSTEAAADLPRAFLDLMNHWEGGDESGHSKYRVIESTDARVDTKRVLSSLLRMLGENAQVIAGARYQLERQGDRTAVIIDGETHTPDLCVIAAGKSIAPLLCRIGADAVAKNFKSICSPIVVLRRALELPNFIRFTPNLPETVNHMKYVVGDRDVSTIGSYDYHPADEHPDIAPFVEKVCRRFGLATSEVVGSYYGTKTEFTGSLERRYNHAVDAVNANTYFAIAGKFSQFPLVVNEFARRLGLRVDIANDTRGTLAMDVADTAPERLTRADAARKPGVKPHAA
jgi:glycine/D-amino acid oxidase-like deaminating enzyme